MPPRPRPKGVEPRSPDLPPASAFLRNLEADTVRRRRGLAVKGQPAEPRERNRLGRRQLRGHCEREQPEAPELPGIGSLVGQFKT